MRAVVIAGGDPPTRAEMDTTARDAAIVIAADSGVAAAIEHALDVHVLVGDLDSADPGHVATVEARGTRVDRHPADKDMTDLELALHAARDLGARSVTVLGAGGGRLDHLFANMLLLAQPEWQELAIDASLDGAIATVVRGTRTLHGAIDDIVTLLAVGGPAHGVSTTGLRWPLVADTLWPGSTRGVSNEVVAAPATVTVLDGVVLAIEPVTGPDTGRSGSP